MNLATAPSIDADIDRLEHLISQVKQKTATYMDKVENTYRIIFSEKRQKALTLKDVIKVKQEEVDRLTQDLNRYKLEHDEIMALEQKAKALEIKLDEIKKSQEQAKQRIAKQKRVSAVMKQNLDCYRKYTGLVYQPIRDNYLKFDFTLIDKHQPDKVFTFTLHLADNGSYKVEECDPMVPHLDTLTADLNQHGDCILFIKLMRQEFCALASTSSSLPPASPPANPSASPPANPSASPPANPPSSPPASSSVNPASPPPASSPPASSPPASL